MFEKPKFRDFVGCLNAAEFTSSELAVLPPPQPARSEIPTAKAIIFFGAMLKPSKTSHFLKTKIHRVRI
jgi:hypothetical protein